MVRALTQTVRGAGLSPAQSTLFTKVTLVVSRKYYLFKRQKALKKAFVAIENPGNLQINKIFHLKDSMVMYGIYNLDTLEKLIDTVHKLHNKTTWNEKLFVGKLNDWYQWYLTKEGVPDYAINSLLYIIMMSEKYVRMYEKFTGQ